MKRRKFLEIVGVSTGAFIFASCSDGSNSDGSNYLSSPDGYIFHKIKTINLDTEQEFQTVMLTNNDRITYKLKDSSANKEYLHTINLNYDGIKNPQILNETIIVEKDEIYSYSTNDNGTIIFSANDLENEYITAIFTYKDDYIVTFLKQGDTVTIDQEMAELTGNFGDLEIDNNDYAFLVCGHEYESMTYPQSAVIYIDTINNTNKDTQHVFSTLQPIIATDHTIHDIGFIDKSKNQELYISQIYIGQNLNENDIQLNGAVVSGRIFEKDMLNQVLPNTLKNTAAFSSQTISGTDMFGPRINDLGHQIIVMKDDDQIYSLYKNNVMVTKESDLTPLDNTIESFYGYIPAESGLLFYQTYTSLQEDELSIFDGVSNKTILTTKTTIEDTEDAPAITELRFGRVRNCIDTENRLVLIANFNDNTQAILLGIPVEG